VVIMPTEVGPVVVEQLVAPPVPESAKFITPLGATAFATPVTVAVKINEPPSTGAPEEARATVGEARATRVELLEAVAATELYAVSPG
jgi:hypothetical protein